MDISNWVIFSSVVTALGVVIALWQGVRNWKYTNLLMAADQRKQASQIRITIPAAPAMLDPADGKRPAVLRYPAKVSNTSEDVITDLWMRATVTVSDPVNGDRVVLAEPVGLRFLPAGESYDLALQSELRPGFDRVAVRMSTTFTDVRDVRWRLDENWKLHRCKDKTEGIPAGNATITVWNEDHPVVVGLLPPTAAGTGMVHPPRVTGDDEGARS